MKNDQGGFTLVELMVVVAIIGLLSAVAIPNFKRYQAKVKVSEAKIQLSALYTAEQIFYSEYDMYAGCLRYMGFDPNPQRNVRHYAIGFSAGYNTRDSGINSAAVTLGLVDDANNCPSSTSIVDGAANAGAADANSATWFPAGKGIGNVQASTLGDMTGNIAGAAIATCTAPAMNSLAGTCVGTQGAPNEKTFKASAIGYISEYGITPETASSWTIDHAKQIRNITTGY